MGKHIVPALDHAPGCYGRVTVLQELYSWLRLVRRGIELNEDLTTKRGIRELVTENDWQEKRKPKAVPKEHVDLALETYRVLARRPLAAIVGRLAPHGGCEVR